MSKQVKNGIRSFIALDIGDEVRKNLSELIDDLKNTRADIRWAKPGSIHLTLKFLGDIPPDDVDRIESAIKKASHDFEPFKIEVKGLGVFPSIKRPRIIWTGLIEPAGTLKRLAKSIENKCAKRGYKPEKRPFKAHLTIGRVRSLKGIDALKGKIEAGAELELGAFKADSIALFKSDIKPGGAVYTVQRSVEL